jgi:lysophospholipase L1-like esterase
VRYAAPKDPRFARLVTFGASLTMGSQDASISQRSQLHGPAAVIARQLGTHLAIPMLKPGFLPSLTPSDIDPLTCRPKNRDIFGTIGTRAQEELIPKLKDQAGNIVLAKLRVDPQLESTNLAIGGFRIGETVSGANSLFGTILEHVVWNPKVDGVGLVSHPEDTQLERLVELQPTIALSTDLIGNDYNNVNLFTDGVPDLSALTPVEELRASLRVLLAQLDATGAQIFLATGPDNTVLPMYREKVAALRAAGFSEADSTGWLQAMRDRIAAYNQVLREEVAAYPRVHLVDLHAKVAVVLAEGVQLEDGKKLLPSPFGGLLSLDTMHFSDTGYAVLANLFLEEINAALGTNVPLVELAPINASDAYSVEALQAAGISCAGTPN